jgi:hypothetical protein
MAQIEKTVFISYRHDDVYAALAVDRHLKSQGYDVFFDYGSIPSGDFEQVIVSNIKARAHFLVILTPTALDRCAKPRDWLRREIETAIDEKRNVVPLFFKGFRFGSPGVSEKLTGKLADLNRYNGLNIHEDYFQEGMEKLERQFLNVPLDAVLHPLPEEVKRVVEEQQASADKDIKRLEPELLHKPEITDTVLRSPPEITLAKEPTSHSIHQGPDTLTQSVSSSSQGEMVFYPTVELSLRTQPLASPDTVIRRVPVTERLVSLEEASIAKKKVGVEGKWLRVKDASKKVGYVAAWYVRLAKDYEARARSISTPADELPRNQFALVPIAELALRSQPVIAPQTTIRRVPVTEQLICLEPPEQAVRKIGVQGKWLKVKDKMSTEGYVAAWFVTRTEGKENI